VIEVLDPRRRRSPPGGQGPRDGLGLTECSQDVPADHLDAFVPVPSPVEKFGGQRGIAADILQPVGQVVGAVEVPADADVLDAGHRPHVLDVVGHLGEGRSRAWMADAVLGAHHSLLIGIRAVHATALHAAASPRLHARHSGDTKSGTKVTMHTPPLPANWQSTSSGTFRG
jgi:hypothetical protein